MMNFCSVWQNKLAEKLQKEACSILFEQAFFIGKPMHYFGIRFAVKRLNNSPCFSILK